jgi:hypothetical protein
MRAILSGMPAPVLDKWSKAPSLVAYRRIDRFSSVDLKKSPFGHSGKAKAAR